MSTYSIIYVFENDAIANKFAEVFALNSANVKFLDLKLENEFEQKFSSYVGNNNINLNISIEEVDCIARELKRGKAAGVDNITCEHLLFYHPIVLSTITKLLTSF